MQKQIKTYLLLVILIFVIAPSFVLASWYNPFSWGIWNRIFHFQKQAQNQTACPAIAKLCPDGSSVSPKGPKCEYPACPQINSLTAGLRIYTNTEYGFEIKIPKDWIIKNNPGELIFTTEYWLKQQEQNTTCLQQHLSDCDPGELPYAIGYFKYIEKDGNKYSPDELQNGTSVIKLNNTEWQRYEMGGMLSNIHFRTTDKQGNGYDFNVYMDTDENLMKLILSTFKFATPTSQTNTQQTACPADTMTCVDGTILHRTSPNCQFPFCPTAQSQNTTQQYKNCATGSNWGCKPITSGENIATVGTTGTVCGCIPVCSTTLKFLVASSATGTWPDGSRKGTFECSSSMPPSEKK